MIPPRRNRDNPHDRGQPAPDNSRILALSDGVFAIALTLLVLDIRVPEVGPDLAAQVRDLLPKFQVYVISFLIIALFWITHHDLFRHIRGHDTTLLGLNAVFLMFVAFLPFPVSLLGGGGNHRFALIFYDACMIVTSLTLSAVWWYVTRDRRLISPAATPAYVREMFLQGRVVQSVFLVSIVVALIDPRVAEWLWLLIPAAWWLIRHWQARTP